MRLFRYIYVNCFNRLRFLAEVRTKLQKVHFVDNLRTITAHGLYISFPMTRHSLCTALFMTPTTNSIKSGKMETESKSASEHSKTLFFVNIKSISIKEVNLSTKGHRHILKGQSKMRNC